MTKRTPIPFRNDKSDPRRKYSGLRGKVVNWVEHTFENGRLYLSVRFITDHTELCWQITTNLTIEQVI